MISIYRVNNYQLRKLLNLQLAAFSHQEQKKKFFKIKDGVKPENKELVYPLQYPKHPLTDNTPIISRERPTRYLTPYYEIPKDMMLEGDEYVKQVVHKNKWTSPQNAYTLNIGLIGPVNAGKSQLFGALSHRISAVSPKASTTKEIVHSYKSFQKQSQQGIKNIQLKYFDTPGLMYKKQGFISKGWKVLSEIDFSLLVVDSAKRFDDMTRQSIKRLEKHRDYSKFMKALVLNKVDLVDNKRKFDSLISQIQKYGKFDKIFYTSAKTGYGIEQLQEYLIGMAKQGEWECPPETRTKMTEVEVMEQMLREGLFLRTYKEVPHDTDIQCTSFTPMSNGKDKINFTIYVGSENIQRMTIGKQGNNINQAIQRFKILYAKYYNKECQVLASVRIRNRFKKKFRGREEILVDDFEQQDAQKLRALEESLTFKRNKGELRRIVEQSQMKRQLMEMQEQGDYNFEELESMLQGKK